MDRDQAIEPILASLVNHTSAPRDVIRGLLHEWIVTPYIVDGEVAASAIMRGPEIHFAVAPSFQHRLLTRARIREFLRPLLAVHGYLTTRMLSGYDIGGEVAFIRRLGFRPTWSAGDTTFYMLTRLPFERGLK